MTNDDYNEKYNIEANETIHDQYANRRSQKSGDMVVVVDGMSGEYAFIGKLIAKSRESYEGIPMSAIDKKMFSDKKLKKELSETFGFTENELNIQLHVFTHYS